MNAVHSHAEGRNNNRILLLATLTSILTRKSNARLSGPHFGQIPHCTEQIPEVCPVEWVVLKMTGTLPKRIFSTPGCCFSEIRMLRRYAKEYLPSRIFSPLASTSIEYTLHCIPFLPYNKLFSYYNLNQFLTSLRSTFRETLMIYTLLYREIPILLFPFHRKRYPLAGGTSSIVHYRDYPSGQWDLVMKFQFHVISCKNSTYDSSQTRLLGILQNETKYHSKDLTKRQ